MAETLPPSELNKPKSSSNAELGFVPGDERVLKAVQTKMGPQDHLIGDIAMGAQDALDTGKPPSPKEIGNMWDDAWNKAWSKAQEDWSKGTAAKPDPFLIKPDFSAVNKELEKAILAAAASGKPLAVSDLGIDIDKRVKTDRSSVLLKEKEDGTVEIHHIRQIRMSPEEEKFFDQRPGLCDALEMSVIGSGRLGYGKRLAPVHVVKVPKKPETTPKAG